MLAKTIVGGAIAATAVLAAAPMALAADYTVTQLNDGATLNVYQLTGTNRAYGNCAGHGTFESSALDFSDYSYNQSNHFYITQAATATLKPGVGPGTYTLSVACDGRGTGSVSFTVPDTTTAPPTTTPAPPAGQNQLSVQLNADTAALPGRMNVYQFKEGNTAFGYCPGDKGVFSSPALTFSGYTYGVDTNHVTSNVFAKATLKPGIVAGAYKLTMTCGKQSISTTFKVPSQQVTKKPVGAPQTGGGATATVFE
ncbi:hypothetical protein [Kutzneria sp. NPDC052558]|uniref:hypothetical protein n=1 Tax=Kutzneria sp. NPDC052558 TaxID=3364121 RepID=UPI0037CC9BF8